MRQTVKILTTIAALAMSGWLSYAHASFFGLTRAFKAEAERVAVDTPVATPVTFQGLPRELKTEVKRGSVEKPSATHVAFFSYPHELKTNVDRISFTTPSLAPMAFVKFCMQYPRECEVRRMAFRRNPVTLTKSRWDELVKVNNNVNHAIIPQANEKGVLNEKWLLSPRAGDCNDYAVSKRHELLARGWPSRSLVLAEVEIAAGEHHLVLMVRTREDDFVLDNLSATVRPVSQIHYRWVRAQSASNPRFWSSISVAKAVRVAMVDR